MHFQKALMIYTIANYKSQPHIQHIPQPMATLEHFEKYLMLCLVLCCRLTIQYRFCLASSPGLPTVQFLIVCSIISDEDRSMHWHQSRYQTFLLCFCILQAIKNWMVRRPGNKAINFVHPLGTYCHVYTIS